MTDSRSGFKKMAAAKLCPAFSSEAVKSKLAANFHSECSLISFVAEMLNYEETGGSLRSGCMLRMDSSNPGSQGNLFSLSGQNS